VEIDVEKLCDKDEIQTLISELDKIFLRDNVDIAYEHYTKFDKYERGDGQDMSSFIIEFERKYDLCKKSEMTLPDAVLSFKLLDSAGLSEKDRQLALTAANDLKFSSMKSALKRIFGGTQHSTGQETGDGITIKQESVCYTNTRSNSQSGQNTRRTQGFNRGFKKNKDHRTKAVTKGTNPLDRYGNHTRCAVCGSVFHWAKDCPHKEEVQQVECEDNTKEGNYNITLFVKDVDPSEVLMCEAFSTAVVDTACTRTVCGQQWLDNCMSILDEDQKSQVKSKPSERVFRFGDGQQVTSVCQVTIPATIGNTKCNIETDVVDSKLPLLLSKNALKKAKTVLNMSDDTASMFDQPVPLYQTSTGHYCVNLLASDIESNFAEDCDILFQEQLIPEEKVLESEVLHVIEMEDKQQQEKELTKIHKQFGHATADKLQKLLVNAGINDSGLFQILDKVVSKCETCTMYKKVPPKPAVGFPLATDFNQTVAVDLHELEKNVWYLHIIDEFTRFSAGAIVNRKLPKVFVQEFILNWISIYGCPKSLFSDNGGEFNNNETRDMCENLNIHVITTAAYAPFSNGLLEKHNHVLTEILLKVKHEKSCSWETALKWALNAKNSLVNVHGFSAYQLVFGRNPNLPANLVNQLPALEGTTSSKTVGEHVGALYTARKAFMEAECSERIRRALRKQVRPYTGDKYQLGDKVYYKRPDNREWKGPGRVIGQDGKIVFVRHGGVLVRVHVCRLRKCSETYSHTANNESSENQQRSDGESKLKSNIVIGSDDHSSVTEAEIAVQVDSQEQPTKQTESEQVNDETQRQGLNIVQSHKIKPGQCIAFRNDSLADKVTARVISRAGKATGKHKHWYNLEYLNSEKDAEPRDLSAVDDLEIIEISDHDEALSDEVMVCHNVTFDDAKQTELNSWKSHGVYKEVPNQGQKCISTRWVLTVRN
jgi:transposase InsO family protein